MAALDFFTARNKIENAHFTRDVQATTVQAGNDTLSKKYNRLLMKMHLINMSLLGTK